MRDESEQIGSHTNTNLVLLRGIVLLVEVHQVLEGAPQGDVVVVDELQGHGRSHRLATRTAAATRPALRLMRRIGRHARGADLKGLGIVEEIGELTFRFLFQVLDNQINKSFYQACLIEQVKVRSQFR